MKRVLITGANSFIGTSFENYLNEKYAEEYQVDTVDMIDGSWRQKSFSDYDAIFHVAGIAHSDSGKISAEKEKLYRSVNTDLTIETAKKAKADGAKQFIFMSSAIVYGNSGRIGKKKIITRETPTNPANCYGDSKVQAELGILPLQDESFKVCVLRPPMIYGKGCKGNFSRLERIADKFKFFPYVKNERSMLYVGNLTEFVRLMIDNEEQGVFWPQNAEYSNTSELVKMIGAAKGKKIHLVKGFGWLFRIMGLFIKLANKVFGNLVYDKDLSQYKIEYRKLGIKESIEAMERK